MRRSQKDTDFNQRKITRRAVVLGGAQLGFMGLLAGRMHQLQVQESDQYRLLAEENRINIRLIAPERGLIYDRKGRLIAGNVQNYGVTIVREDAGDFEEVIRRLRTLVALEDEKVERAINEIRRRSPFVPVLLADGLSWEDLSKVAVNAPALPGISPEVGQSRIYPFGADFAHTVGYMGRVTERDLERTEDDDPLLQLPQFQIGKFGAEGRLDRDLRGKAGVRRIEVNAVGRVMRELGREPGQPGANLRLTIDAELQNFVQARLGEESAASVVIDLKTGDVVAAASAPTFDPNLFIGGISQAEFDPLLNNDHRPLHNKIVQGLYPPGSTFKMITLLAGLEDGQITADERINCKGHVELASRKFHCWKGSGHGNTAAIKAIVESCDSYFYELSLRIGIEKIASMARKLGLGVAHDVGMTSVSSGLVPDKEWKLRVRQADWVLGDTLNASIGQGFVLSSPLQLAVMTGKLALGREVTPRMIKSVDGAEQPSGIGGRLDMNPEHLDLIREAMFGVVNSNRGTAKGSRIISSEQKLAGKTGTSQVRNYDSERKRFGRVLDDEEVPWKQRDHAVFVGYAPYDNPRYAVSVVVEHGGGGSKAAAPVARDVILAAMNGGRPPVFAYPSSQRRDIERRLRGLELKDIPDVSSTGRSQA